MGNNRLSRGRHRHNQHLFFRPVMNSQTPAHIAHPKTIKSFVTRAGRTTGGQAKALAELGPRFVLPFQHGVFSAEQAFGRIAPLILEIGFGMGDATAQIALTRPDDNFLCCEVHEPGVGRCSSAWAKPASTTSAYFNMTRLRYWSTCSL